MRPVSARPLLFALSVSLVPMWTNAQTAPRGVRTLELVTSKRQALSVETGPEGAVMFGVRDDLQSTSCPASAARLADWLNSVRSTLDRVIAAREVIDVSGDGVFACKLHFLHGVPTGQAEFALEIPPITVSLTRAEARQWVVGADSARRLADRSGLRGTDMARRPDAATTERQTFGASGRIYFEFQVDRRAEVLANNPLPAYPAMLKAANIEGSVLAQFVLDTTGHPEPATFKVLRSTHDMFSSSVKDVLPLLRFSPAEISGQKVRQLVQMTFPFVVRDHLFQSVPP